VQISGQDQYDCIGFHNQLPKGKASGIMTIHSGHIEFCIAEQRINLPLQGLKVSLGGASNRLVYFENPNLPGWNFYTSDRRVLKNPQLHRLPSVSKLLRGARNKHWFGWGLITAVITLIVAVPLLIVLRMDFFTGVIAKKIPLEWEQKIGESAIAQYQFGKQFLDQQESERLLKPLVDPLINALENSRYQYRFQIVKEGSLNAFALPGGQVVIHSELILRADSAEELLGVLAHEIQHVEQQHGLRNVIGTSGIYMIASAVFGDTSGLLALVSGAAPLLINQSYSRGFETQADLEGFALLQKANINPIGLARFFEKMIEEEKKQMDKLIDQDNQELAKQALKFLSTHPASEDRIKRLQLLAEKNAPKHKYQNLQLAFVELKTAVARFVANDQGDTPNEN
jgi:Zn-dependent protease with chaperone function